MKRKTSKRGSAARAVPMCVITIMDGGAGEGGKKEGFFLEACADVHQRLLDEKCSLFTTTTNTAESLCVVMFAYNSFEGGVNKFTKDDLVHLAWELEKNFDYQITCKTEILPDPDKKEAT